MTTQFEKMFGSNNEGWHVFWSGVFAVVEWVIIGLVVYGIFVGLGALIKMILLQL